MDAAKTKTKSLNDNYIFSSANSAKLFVGLVLILFLADSIAQEKSSIGAAELEWVDRQELTAEQLEDCPRSCGGIYVEKPRSYSGLELDPREADLEVVSDLTEVDGEDNSATMVGSVELTQGWRSVEAQSVRILRDENRIEMSGDIRMREPGLLITGQAASIENSSQALEFENAEFVLHDLGVRGTAGEVGRDETGRFYVLNATYSTCEPGKDSWSLSASEISIDEDQIFATAKNMVIRVGRVPIFYAPWFAFPVGEGRQTGMLYPDIGRSGDNGIDIAQPIYLNLAPDHDMTITPRYIQKRGSGLEIENRNLGKSYFSQINLALLPDDQGGGTNEYLGESRWRSGLASTANFSWGEALVDYNQVSDVDYFDDLGSPSQEINTNTYLKQYAVVSRDTEHWNLAASVLLYQSLAEDLTDSYRELPNLSFNGKYQTGGFNWQLNHQLIDFSHGDDNIANSANILQSDINGTWVTGQRAALDYSLSRSFHMPWGRSEAELLSFFRSYELDQPLADYQDNSPSIEANGIRLYTEVNFERRASLFGADWIQSIQPAVQYLNIDAQSQSQIPIFDTRNASPSYSGLFRTNRFVGGDRVGDANRITLGVTSRLIDPSHGNQVARFSVGQAIYLEDRKVHTNELIQLGLDGPEAYALDDPLYLLAIERQEALNELAKNQSNLIAEAEFRLSSEWIVTTDAHLNTSTGGFERGHLNFSYLANDSLSAFNFGYRFVKNNSIFLDENGDALIQSTELFEGNTSQYDLSGLHAVNDNWVLVARWQHDAALDRSVEKLTGVRYDSCCWSVGVFWRDWLRRDDNVVVPQTDLRQDNGIFISFELKGLAGVGQGIENLLENGIPGYNRETF